MKAKVEISPSIAAGNLMNLSEEISRLESADSIHFDVMDGHFVPLLTLGVPMLEQVRKLTKKFLDVHIMVSNPESTFQFYLEAGADLLTFHPQVASHSHRLCQSILNAGKKVGIALNPDVHPSSIEFLLPLVDQVTIMCVNPGYSRQPHLYEMHNKIILLKKMLDDRNLKKVKIQVDGGVSKENINKLYSCGAQVFVAGGSVFNAPNYAQAIEELRCSVQ
jgi:ribulose-phosphate 3-epimerase